MAKLDDLIGQVADASLRSELAKAAKELRKQKRFGLVFEEHIPEVTLLRDFPIRPGALVHHRQDLTAKTPLRVEAVKGRKATVTPLPKGPAEEVSLDDLLVVKRFGDPIYPALQSVGSEAKGKDRPYHAVINAENYHALQLLVYLYEGQADCIYIDPPYNTGARDWKYNNRYVDTNDSWRHSKWLSMMDKRLRLARRLLKPDGVLIVTIDEHEVHHLGVLLEQLFRKYLRYVVTIVISARGNFKANFSRVEEYAVFCCPDIGRDVITGAPVDYLPESAELEEDRYADEEDVLAPEEADDPESLDEEFELRHARRRGPDSERAARPSMFYPLLVDEEHRVVVRAGLPIAKDEEPDLSTADGLRPVWPIDTKGVQRRWRWGRERMAAAIESGDVVLGKHNAKLDSWTINLRIPKTRTKNIKTVWRTPAHDAGTYGTSLLETFLGQSRLFSFPKSLYATRDTLAAVCRNRPDALIIDFFAGSATTLHSTCLLNQDGGRRRCVVVTNNEVDEQRAKQLAKDGYYPGDPEYERHGIFEAVARPRVEAAIRGQRPDGTPVPGTYLDGRPYADGFEENVEFFDLGYLEPDDIELGRQFQAILPALWLAAGGIGPRPKATGKEAFVLPDHSPFGVLLRESAFRKFAEALAARPDVTHVWLVTDSERAFTDMRGALPGKSSVSMLYRDYLRNFAINTIRNL